MFILDEFIHQPYTIRIIKGTFQYKYLHVCNVAFHWISLMYIYSFIYTTTVYDFSISLQRRARRGGGTRQVRVKSHKVPEVIG
jgi:hypothetical protein